MFGYANGFGDRAIYQRHVSITRNYLLNAAVGPLELITSRSIRSAKNQLRADLGPLEGLALSIEEQGLLQPIVVRPLEDGYEVVAGNRRLAACRILKIREIPCHVVYLDDKEAFEVSLIENVQHRSLSPIEEARAFRKYVEDFGYGGIADLARNIGKSHSYVSRRIALLSLPLSLQQDLLLGRTSASVVQELFSLPEDERLQVSESGLGGVLTRREARRAAAVRRVSLAEADGSYYSIQDRKRRLIERAIAGYIASLRVCMMRLDEVLNTIGEDEWFTKEVLMEQRAAVHNQVDLLLKLKRRSRRLPVESLC